MKVSMLQKHGKTTVAQHEEVSIESLEARREAILTELATVEAQLSESGGEEKAESLALENGDASQFPNSWSRDAQAAADYARLTGGQINHYNITV